MHNRMIAVVAACVACVASPVCAQWYGGADFLVTARHTNSSTAFQRNQTTTGGTTRVGSTVTLGEDDFELGFAPAARITLGNRTGEFGVEGSYLRTEDWVDAKFVGASPPTSILASPFTLVGAVADPEFDGNLFAQVNYQTQLETAEFNLTQRIYSGPNGDASLMYGARYMAIDESMIYESENAFGPTSLLTTTQNQIIGPQLGALIESPVFGGQINFTFKCAVGFNDIDKTTQFAHAGTTTPGTGGEGSAAVIGEVGVDCQFFPTRYLSIRIGYHLLAASQIALATNNLESNVSVLESGLANVETDAGVAYHSPFVGAMFTY